MAGSDQSTSAQDEPAPLNPKRVWDKYRHCWVEAISVCRRTDGKYGRKNGTEPDAQLNLFGKDAA